MHWGYGTPMGWWMVFSWLIWILIVAALIWAVGSRWDRSRLADDSPETILKRRYARGEINREEYEQRMSDLRR